MCNENSKRRLQLRGTLDHDEASAVTNRLGFLSKARFRTMLLMGQTPHDAAVAELRRHDLLDGDDLAAAVVGTDPAAHAAGAGRRNGLTFVDSLPIPPNGADLGAIIFGRDSTDLSLESGYFQHDSLGTAGDLRKLAIDGLAVQHYADVDPSRLLQQATLASGAATFTWSLADGTAYKYPVFGMEYTITTPQATTEGLDALTLSVTGDRWLTPTAAIASNNNDTLVIAGLASNRTYRFVHLFGARSTQYGVRNRFAPRAMIEGAGSPDLVVTVNGSTGTRIRSRLLSPLSNWWRAFAGVAVNHEVGE